MDLRQLITEVIAGVLGALLTASLGAIWHGIKAVNGFGRRLKKVELAIAVLQGRSGDE